MATVLRTMVLLVAALAASPAIAQRVGAGSGKSSAAPPPTKSRGIAPERAGMPGTDPLIEPRHGLPGAPGAALDSAGSSRLGAPSDRIAGATEMPSSWNSGDRIRSWTSDDVRAARQQEAPDLEWAASRSAPSPPAAEQRRSGPEKRGAGRKR